jgi:hypothetical protein
MEMEAVRGTPNESAGVDMEVEIATGTLDGRARDEGVSVGVQAIPRNRPKTIRGIMIFGR